MSEPVIINVEKPVLETRCLLGEGPLWDSATNTLHFVDIAANQIHTWNPDTGARVVKQFDEPIGCLALRKPENKGGLAVAAKKGFAIVNPALPMSSSLLIQTPDPANLSNPDSSLSISQATLTYLSEPFALTKAPASRSKVQRFNDGACDPKGRMFAGTLEAWDPDEPAVEGEDVAPTSGVVADGPKKGKYWSGELWMFDPATGETKLVDGDIKESNGLAWSADGKTIYYTDSGRRVIFACDYDVETGNVGPRREMISAGQLVKGFTTERENRAFPMPDGMCMDSEGGIWSASWQGSRITRFAPSTWEITHIIKIPSAFNVTACTFGGVNNDKLYITSASPRMQWIMDSEEGTELQERFKNSGDLFMVDFEGQFQGGQWRWEFAA